MRVLLILTLTLFSTSIFAQGNACEFYPAAWNMPANAKSVLSNKKFCPGGKLHSPPAVMLGGRKSTLCNKNIGKFGYTCINKQGDIESRVMACPGKVNNSQGYNPMGNVNVNIKSCRPVPRG
ncbi:MAG: hypothetical protein CMF50_09385 [Legionellales bacterium]|nr:hypothetical protein [Legionellales bacterium]